MSENARLSIATAFAQLRAVCGDSVHVGIYPPQISSLSALRALQAGPWQVYLGAEANAAHDIYQGQTLSDAVSVAILAYRKAMHPEEVQDESTRVDDIIDTVAELVPLCSAPAANGNSKPRPYFAAGQPVEFRFGNDPKWQSGTFDRDCIDSPGGSIVRDLNGSPFRVAVENVRALNTAEAVA